MVIFAILNVFLLSSSVFIVEFEHLNDGWKCKLHDFNNRYTSDHQQFKKPDKDTFAVTITFQSILKISGISKKKLRNLALVNKQMLAHRYTEIDLSSRHFAWNKLKFLQELFINIIQRSIQDLCKHLRLRNNKQQFIAIIVDS